MSSAPPILQVLHEAPGYVAVSKPAGIATELHYDHDTVAARAQTLWQRPSSPQLAFVGIVHRLDRPVGGVLLLARNKSTLRFLNDAFAERKVRKTYVALTADPLPQTKGNLRHYLARDASNRRAVAYGEPGSKRTESYLRYRLLGREKGGHYRYEIQPVTGRFHQIRCQLAAAGAPIVGDMLYGSAVAVGEHLIRLHATALSFPDPNGGDLVTVTDKTPF